MPLLGCIADDFTGATDLGSQLVRGGLRCVQWLGLPEPLPDCSDVDAVVVALKSRCIPAADAIGQSLTALERLQAVGCTRFYFKYCSTFDSTPQGNIGPVAEALAEALGAASVIFCPAFPENGRTVYQGHLFVGNQLLCESGMQHHPLNPMTDANLVRVLRAQTRGEVGVVPLSAVAEGASRVNAALCDLARHGTCLAVVDAVAERDLATIAGAVAEQPLVTGGSALGRYLADEYRNRGWVTSQNDATFLPQITGHSAVIAGSCSMVTRRQVAHFANRWPALVLDGQQLLAANAVGEALRWARPLLESGPVLIATSADPDQVATVRAALGPDAAHRIEHTLAEIAAGLVSAGVRRLVVAGGETSGAVLQRLGVSALKIGPAIDPGVPWTESLGPTPLALALKSGNFGADDFFLRAWELLP